ncbi:hypothetical protein [Anaerospora sp.]|uniref:hypothetical protein n=1 Tax=Anaerospora sp. TaxID=1960278 RepID=UPI002898FCFF|nr:hypothetical protein [Anaerospora sp.]
MQTGSIQQLTSIPIQVGDTKEIVQQLKLINEKLDVIVAAHFKKNGDAIRKILRQVGMTRASLISSDTSKFDLEQHVVALGKENTALKAELEERRNYIRIPLSIIKFSDPFYKIEKLNSVDLGNLLEKIESDITKHMIITIVT